MVSLEDAHGVNASARPRDEPNRRLGHWRDHETPKRGWFCRTVEHLSDHAMVTCGMCQCARARFAYGTVRTDHAKPLLVGRECYGVMQGDPGKAAMMERECRNQTIREARAAEPTAVLRAAPAAQAVAGAAFAAQHAFQFRWRSTSKGNPQRPDLNAVVYTGKAGWKIMTGDAGDTPARFYRESHTSAVGTMLAAEAMLIKG